MLTVYFSPHSESIDNKAGRASGHADVPLTPHGLEVAKQLGEHYHSIVLDAVFSSDLQRAAITSKLAFSSREIPHFQDSRLREFDYGKLTQCPREELALDTHIREPFPDGESIAMAVKRVGDFLHEIMQRYDGKTIVVIGHVATKYGLAYWAGNASLEDIVGMKWEWLDVPIWQYHFSNPLKSIEP